ncbi:flavodoxin domain-containing protein [Clostridium sp. CCUG 7971]|uniref:flavodoxin domain-containing protein n=1 Tax=Clostridium sp. CCUG 7971 TaxID=2811414 RepID=UPI001ABA7FBA|nr:flavodoxin domain-containing protein [Clostridium sp. CCUG 7971]MBO3444189.1 flavodoxin [Clostridium sp. CCUG 7971]
MGDKIAVIYKSKYGTTKRYAGWIALKLGGDLYELSDIRSKDLDRYDTVIYGGPLYVGKIKGVDFIIKNYEKLLNKNLIVFVVGMESYSEECRNKIIKNNFEGEIIDKMDLYHFKGAFSYKELGIIDKAMMKFMKKNIEAKGIRDLTDDDKNLLKGFESSIDLADKKYINNLIDHVYSISK